MLCTTATKISDDRPAMISQSCEEEVTQTHSMPSAVGSAAASRQVPILAIDARTVYSPRKSLARLGLFQGHLTWHESQIAKIPQTHTHATLPTPALHAHTRTRVRPAHPSRGRRPHAPRHTHTLDLCHPPNGNAQQRPSSATAVGT